MAGIVLAPIVELALLFSVGRWTLHVRDSVVVAFTTMKRSAAQTVKS
jgi:hypothetical protein